VGAVAGIAKLGASLTDWTLICNATGSLSSSPPFAVPPLSRRAILKAGHTTDVRRGREAQLTVAGNGGRAAEQGRIAVAQHHKVDGLHFVRVAII
jgi:hypothetical protein